MTLLPLLLLQGSSNHRWLLLFRTLNSLFVSLVGKGEVLAITLLSLPFSFFHVADRISPVLFFLFASFVLSFCFFRSFFFLVSSESDPGFFVCFLSFWRVSFFYRHYIFFVFSIQSPFFLIQSPSSDERSHFGAVTRELSSVNSLILLLLLVDVI